MKKNLIYLVATLLFAGAGAWYGVHTKQEPAPITTTAPAGVTGPAAAMLKETLPNDKGEKVALSKWQGKALLVNFWAPWCAPCVEEMPELSAADIPEPDRRVITPAQQIAVVYMTMLAVIRGPCSSSLT